MVKRKRIALIYSYNESWIGGTYYVENLINALTRLPDLEQPYLLIHSLGDSDEARLRKMTSYKYIEYRRFEKHLSLVERVLNKITYLLVNKRFFSVFYNDAEIVFPILDAQNTAFQRIPNHLFWIPDFQEHYLPHFFSSEEIMQRKQTQEIIQANGQNILFSSKAVQNDFNIIYPNSRINQFVLPFVTINGAVNSGINECINKYGINRPYFICSNQFWQHKNHKVVLKAISAIKKTRPEILVLFTGKEYDYRNPNYFAELQSLQSELELQYETQFLGFISRVDQLTLMKNSLAIIQPSLFEGWSTVIEDAKSLNVPIIASNLPVNIEQLAEYKAKLYFDPENHISLSECLVQSLTGNLKSCYYNYDVDIEVFAKKFVEITSSIIA